MDSRFRSGIQSRPRAKIACAAGLGLPRPAARIANHSEISGQVRCGDHIVLQGLLATEMNNFPSRGRAGQAEAGNARLRRPLFHIAIVSFLAPAPYQGEPRNRSLAPREISFAQRLSQVPANSGSMSRPLPAVRAIAPLFAGKKKTKKKKKSNPADCSVPKAIENGSDAGVCVELGLRCQRHSLRSFAESIPPNQRAPWQVQSHPTCRCPRNRPATIAPDSL